MVASLGFLAQWALLVVFKKKWYTSFVFLIGGGKECGKCLIFVCVFVWGVEECAVEWNGAKLLLWFYWACRQINNQLRKDRKGLEQGRK
jgi:hypothetical protein